MRFLYTLFFSLSLLFASAQILDPVDVDFEMKELGNGEMELIAKVTMDPEWHVYSIKTPDTSLIMGSRFELVQTDKFKLLGEAQEPKPHCEYDKYYMQDLCSHEGTIRVRQKIKVLSKEDIEITGTFSYQTCNAETCLPPEYIDYTFEIKGSEVAATNDTKAQAQEALISNDKSEASKDEANKGEETAETSKGGEPLELDYSEDTKSEDAAKNESQTKKEGGVHTASDDEEASRSLWGIFILSFLGGK
ncbi:MAG: protein-disulfide reductase DsbD domain-containing protein [Croceimicrobium sp.]